MTGLYLEEFELSQVLRHDIRRTVIETDNVLFSSMTLNPATIHLDAEDAKGTEFGRLLMNSAFTPGLIVGISVGNTTLGTMVGNLGWDEARFPRPVFAGDTLRVESAALRKAAQRVAADERSRHLPPHRLEPAQRVRSRHASGRH